MNYKELKYNDFPLRAYDKVRFGDTDKQGHVNNANFATYLETGRTEFLYLQEGLLDDNATFVIAKIDLDYVAEVTWPGTVEIGSGVKRIGNSSVVFHQNLYQNGILAAVAETVIVQMDETTRRSKPLNDFARAEFEKCVLAE